MTKSTLILLLAFVSNIVFAQYNSTDLRVVSQDIGEPLTYKHLQLFPIYANSSFQEANQHVGNYLSLQTALETNLVTINEIETSAAPQSFDPFSNSLIVSQEITSYEEDMNAINPNKSRRIESTSTSSEEEDGMFSIFDDRILHPDARVNAHAVTTQIYITNHSQDTIFLMAGEVLQGGLQDRVIAQDMFIPPSKEKVHLPVFCAEKDRWYYRSKSGKDFDKYFAVSSLKVRKAVTTLNDQAAVWDAIEDIQLTNNIESKTKAYTDLKASMGFNAELEEYITYFRQNLQSKINSLQMQSTNDKNKEKEKIVGLVVATGGNIIGCDIFATQDLFVQQYNGLLHSYATDAITYGQKVNNQLPAKSIGMNQEQLDEYLAATLKLSEKNNSSTTTVNNGIALEEEVQDEKSFMTNLSFSQKVHISSFE